jgi:hypothetical protein
VGGKQRKKIDMKKTPTKNKKPNKQSNQSPQILKKPNKRVENPYDHQPNAHKGIIPSVYDHYGICE